MQHRFFVPEGEAGARAAGATVVFSPAQAEQMARVLRLRPGDRVIAVAAGVERVVELTAVSARSAAGRVVESRTPEREPPLRVVLAQALPKGDKMEMIVQKAVELGAAEVRPLRTSRCVVQLDAERAGARVRRWRAIAREAAEQSGRIVVPPVDEVASLADALAEARADGGRALFLWEGEAAAGLRDALRPAGERLRTLWLFVGPEGGWTPGEVALARDAGALPVSLGPRVLRTETAGPAALAMVFYELGDLGRVPATER